MTSDRNVLVFGPVLADNPKALANTSDTVRKLEEFGTGGGLSADAVTSLVNDALSDYMPVMGSIGTVIGIPPGVPFVYNPPNLTAFPVGLAATVYTAYSDVSDAGALELDTFGVIGSAGSLVALRSGGTELVSYNPSAGEILTVAVPASPVTGSLLGAFQAGSVLVTRHANGTAFRVFDGTAWTHVQLTVPRTGAVIIGMGPDGSGNVAVVWGMQASGVAYVDTQLFTSAGVLVGVTHSQTFTAVTVPETVVQAGRAVMLVRTTSTTYQLLQRSMTGSGSWSTVSITPAWASGVFFRFVPRVSIGASGTGWSVGYSGLIQRFTASGVVSTFASSWTGFATQLTSVRYVSDTKLAVTGWVQEPSGSSVLRTALYAIGEVIGGIISWTVMPIPAISILVASSSGVYPVGSRPVVSSVGNVAFILSSNPTGDVAYLFEVAS